MVEFSGVYIYIVLFFTEIIENNGTNIKNRLREILFM